MQAESLSDERYRSMDKREVLFSMSLTKNIVPDYL